MHFVPYLLGPYWLGDSATIFQLGFQDPATTTMEGVRLFNKWLITINLFYYKLVRNRWFNPKFKRT